jgi:hypothetical protein
MLAASRESSPSPTGCLFPSPTRTAVSGTTSTSSVIHSLRRSYVTLLFERVTAQRLIASTASSNGPRCPRLSDIDRRYRRRRRRVARRSRLHPIRITEISARAPPHGLPRPGQGHGRHQRRRNPAAAPSPRMLPSMTSQKLENFAHLRRARDLIDREDTKPLGVRTKPQSARVARAVLAPVARGVWRDSVRLPDDPQVEGPLPRPFPNIDN